MKKILVLLFLFAFVAPMFADDALVLPARVIRIYMVPSYSFYKAGFDTDGEKQDIEKENGRFKGVNLAAALEYGITDWLTAAVQWTPGWNIWSKFDYPEAAAPRDKMTVNGPYDIFAGAKVQILGEKGLVYNDIMRFAMAVGAIIPMPSSDWEKQAEKAADGDPWKAVDPDKHTFGIGSRFYFDYVLNEMFYINLYSEFKYFFPKAYEDVSMATSSGGADDYKYGYDLTLEVEPHFETMVSDGIRLGVAVPVTYVMTPERKIDDTSIDDSNTHILKVGPNVSLFLMNSPVPLEFELFYSLPLIGKNVKATNTIGLQVKSYLKF